MAEMPIQSGPTAREGTGTPAHRPRRPSDSERISHGGEEGDVASDEAGVATGQSLSGCNTPRRAHSGARSIPQKSTPHSASATKTPRNSTGQVAEVQDAAAQPSLMLCTHRDVYVYLQGSGATSETLEAFSRYATMDGQLWCHMMSEKAAGKMLTDQLRVKDPVLRYIIMFHAKACLASSDSTEGHNKPKPGASASSHGSDPRDWASLSDDEWMCLCGVGPYSPCDDEIDDEFAEFLCGNNAMDTDDDGTFAEFLCGNNAEDWEDTLLSWGVDFMDTDDDDEAQGHGNPEPGAQRPGTYDPDRSWKEVLCQWGVDCPDPDGHDATRGHNSPNLGAPAIYDSDYTGSDTESQPPMNPVGVVQADSGSTGHYHRVWNASGALVKQHYRVQSDASGRMVRHYYPVPGGDGENPVKRRSGRGSRERRRLRRSGMTGGHDKAAIPKIRCAATTKEGNPCSRGVSMGSMFCKQHIPMATVTTKSALKGH